MMQFIRNGASRLVAACLLAVVAVTGAFAQATPPDYETLSETLRDSIYTNFTAMLPALLSVFAVFIGWHLLRRLGKSVSK